MTDDVLLDRFNEMMQDEDFLNTWNKLHNPWVRNSRKISPNEICPYCNSGKKFKKCECSKTHKVSYDYYMKPEIRRDKTIKEKIQEKREDKLNENINNFLGL